ncbi:MAG: hypothetical protein R3C03_06810 [Pirellulaceae bacterium]
MGQEVVPVLQAALPTGDAEVDWQLRRLVAVLGVKNFERLSPDFLEIVSRFGQMEIEQQVNLAYQLFYNDRVDLVMDLLGALEDFSRANAIMEDSFTGDYLMNEVVRCASPGDVSIANHPFVRRHYPNFKLFLAQQEGTFEIVAKQLIDEVVSTADYQAASRLAQVLLKLKRRDLAEGLTAIEGWAPFEPNSPETLIANNDWEGLWQATCSSWAVDTLPQSSREFLTDEAAMDQLRQRLAVAYLTGRQDDYQVAARFAEEMLNGVDSADTFQMLAADGVCAALGATGSLDVVINHYRKRQLVSAVGLLTYLHRFEDAGDAVGLTGDPAADLGIVDTAISQMNAADRKSGRGGDDTAGAEAQKHSKFLHQLTEFLQETGRCDFALIVAKRLLNEQGDEAYDGYERRREAIQLLMKVADAKTAWTTIGSTLSPQSYEFWYLSAAFGNSQESAVFDYWYDQFENVVPESLERWQLVAALMKHRLTAPGKYDSPMEYLATLETEVNRVNDRNEAGEFYWNASQVALLHGDEAKYREWLAKSADEYSNPAATFSMAQAAQEAGDEEVALKYLKAAYENDMYQYNDVALRAACQLASISMRHNRVDQTRFYELAALTKLTSCETPVFTELIDDGFSATLVSMEPFVGLDDAPSSGAFSQFSRGWLIDALLKTDVEAAKAESEKMIYALATRAPSHAVFVTYHYQRHIFVLGRSLLARGEINQLNDLITRNRDFLKADATFAEMLLGPMLESDESGVAEARYDEFISEFRDLLAQYPTADLLLNNFAWALACCRRDVDLAIRCSRLSVEREPGSSASLDTLAELYFQNGDYENALAFANQALARSPLDAHYRKQLEKIKAAISAGEE